MSIFGVKENTSACTERGDGSYWDFSFLFFFWNADDGVEDALSAS